ncbi:hypothetical protein Pmani_024205 [Petrolisthes manimaculis]|uniref:Bestrophin homolog n=1 Tax=Petrolisthes manimaculis TaxID=1843537 RepID=A0AAE1PAP5_9EUCA|nr:hypothetical protein Pmani_024205 [Petrolisthes manimaculis]
MAWECLQDGVAGYADLSHLILLHLIHIPFALDGEHKSNFESLVIHCARFRNLIPVSFVLGFFVSLVVSRWWGVYQSLPWPDTLAILLATHIPATTAEARRVREIILRYINLTIALTFAMVSPVVKKKLPSLHHFHAAGYITEEEMRAWENLEENNSQHKTWVPVVWACRAVDEARKEQILNDTAHRILIGEILRLRGQCGSLMGWNEYNVPLVYTQVVTIAVYSYFFFSVLGEQFLDPNIAHPSHTIDLYVPVFALLQLFFYIGWIKVAEALLNPFGSDDHDFEFMPLLNRHKEMVVLLSEQSRGALTPKSPTDPSTNTQSLNLKYIDEPVHVYYDDDDDQDNNDGAGSGSVGNVIPEA